MGTPPVMPHHIGCPPPMMGGPFGRHAACGCFILILMLIERKTLYDPKVHSPNIPQRGATQYAQPEKQAKNLAEETGPLHNCY